MPCFAPVDVEVVSIVYRAPVGCQTVRSAHVGDTSLRCATSTEAAVIDRFRRVSRRYRGGVVVP